MDQNGLLALYHYNVYANGLVLATAGQLTEAALASDASPSHGSVCGLLVHMLAVETYFLCCCQEQPMEQADVVTLADIRHKWAELERAQEDYVTDLDDTRCAREIRIQMGDHALNLTVWQMLTQAFMHSTHHRGELSIVLTQLGHPLPTLDIIIHLVRQSGQVWPWE